MLVNPFIVVLQKSFAGQFHFTIKIPLYTPQYKYIDGVGEGGI